MAEVKFKVGDKVRFSRRCPLFVSGPLRGRTRTIVGKFYDVEYQATFYELGGRGKSRHGRFFRSYELVKARALNKPGKPPW